MNASSPLVHPFPARMAPQLALDRLPRPQARSFRILDPMMGSGTIPVLAAMRKHEAVGFDSDPLAVLMACAWGRPLAPRTFMSAVREVVRLGRKQEGEAFTHPDPETQKFIDYWFDRQTQQRLAALARAIVDQPADLQVPLWCAFSRLIITKDAGASRARDVSHSRPHRVRTHASFDPLDKFAISAEVVLKRHRALGKRRPTPETLLLDNGDARALPLPDGSIDVVMTSPPYLQAIDYMRGHRFSLVWMGYSVGELREVRGTSIGSERQLDSCEDWCRDVETEFTGNLSPRSQGILRRYIIDLDRVTGEIARVLDTDGKAIFVVADATISGSLINVGELLERVAVRHGLQCRDRLVRELPRNRRYLPPPSGGTSALDKRMRSESCLTFTYRG
jgi:hypothetical protein